MINSAGSCYDASCRKVGSKSALDSKWDSACEYKVETTKNGWKAVLTLDKKKCGTWNPEGFAVNFARSRVLKNQAVELLESVPGQWFSRAGAFRADCPAEESAGKYCPERRFSGEELARLGQMAKTVY